MEKIDSFINKIIQGDCLEIMKEMPDKSVDLVLTDPPYGMNKGDWDKKPFYEIGKECFRVMKDNSAIYMFCGDNSYIQARQEIEKFFSFHRTIIWEKENIYGGGDYLLAHENILYAKKGNPIFNNIGRLATSNQLKNIGKEMAKEKSIWKSRGFNNTCAEYVGHPTQKPIEIIKKIILNSSIENDIVLDPFLGSGTTAVAAKMLNRKFIGIEIEPKYVKIAQDRLRSVSNTLFEPEKPKVEQKILI